MPDRTTLLVGTTNGLFRLTSEDRDSWQLAGPFCEGWPVNHAAADAQTGRLWAAGGNDWFGAAVWRSRDAQTIWTLPLNGDMAGRFSPEASAAMWKSTDGGESWVKHQAGLPERDCFFTGLRQAMSTDAGDPAGVYFGTNSGSVFASRDEGASRDEIARHLPAVLCVEAAEI